jgi:hypothetical protein
MLDTPVVGGTGKGLSHLRPLQVFYGLPTFQKLVVLFLLGRRCGTAHFSFNSASLILADVRQALLPPHNLSKFDMLEDHVDFLELGVINDFKKGHDIRVSDFLLYGNLLLGLILG